MNMNSLINIIKIYLENPQDKDMERVLNRESNKRNLINLYKSNLALGLMINKLECKEERLLMLIDEILNSIPESYLQGYNWEDDLKDIMGN